MNTRFHFLQKSYTLCNVVKRGCKNVMFNEKGKVKIVIGYDEYYFNMEDLGVDPDDVFVHELEEAVREKVLELVNWDWRIDYE